MHPPRLVLRKMILLWFACCAVSCGMAGAAELAPGANADDRLLQLGLLDVTRAPYSADPTGVADCTKAIQGAVNEARDRGLVCFFPAGTYLISDTISCEQQVSKLDTPRHVDGGTQHYWPVQRAIVLMGSTKGQRPVLKLSRDAIGFDDPAKPKRVIWIWAQTWFDAPGKEEPEWGKEQPNISFSHVFKGIDIDIRGHAGAIGIRHSGSQGSSLQDSTIYAEGAHAGMSNCCGQGGGTYNIEVVGGEYGITIQPDSRFPILTGCAFKGQTKAAIHYTRAGSQVPTLLVGCQIEPAGDAAIDFSAPAAYAGISLVDCIVEMKRGGVIARTTKSESIYLEDSFVKGPVSVSTHGGKLPAAETWTRIERYSAHAAQGVHLVNGVESTGEIAVWKPAESVPSFESIRDRHYSRTPSFEDPDAVNVKAWGAKGDGSADDTQAFKDAIAASDKVFVPKGNFVLSGELRLGPKTHLFGLTRSFSSIGGAGFDTGGRKGRAGEGGKGALAIFTADDAHASPGFSFLSVRGRVDWRSGKGVWMLASGSPAISGHGGGRFYGVMAMGRPFILRDITQPTFFYALNVERVTSNPQSQIQDCAQLRIYYFKVEAGTIQRANAGDGNTPCRISDSRDVRVYCMYGLVRGLGERPMLDIANSENVVVSQLKSFQPGAFPHVAETNHGAKYEIPSAKICALFVRETEGSSDE